LDRPRLLAILNVTPDSFSDAGAYVTPEDAARAAERFVSEGADAIDLGGESTRPGAAPVAEAVQIGRVMPVLQLIRRAMGDAVPITVDTTLSAVARAALDAGADAINDVSAGTHDPMMLPLAAERGAGIILMHRLTTPARDSYSDRYAADPVYDGGVVAGVRGYLESRARAAVDAGIPCEQIVLDPGLGFGKSVSQNLELIERTQELVSLGFPILSGVSRKSFTARAAGLSAETLPRDRLHATLGLGILHLLRGVRLFRVHDVAAHAQALGAAWAALLSSPGANT
jgi:dihydropteroate synthase